MSDNFGNKVSLEEETDEDRWKIEEALCGHPEFLLEEDWSHDSRKDGVLK